MSRLVDTWIRELLSTLEGADRELADEIRSVQLTAPSSAAGTRRRVRASPAMRAIHAVRDTRRAVHGAARSAVRAATRNIVLRVGRPVLAVVRGVAQLELTDNASAVWRSRLEAASGALHRAALSVGRIEVKGLPGVGYVGTGWLVAPEIAVTNRHVALAFGARLRKGFGFRSDGDAALRVSIDFLEEPGRREQLEFAVTEILHIEDASGPDFAFVRVEPRSGRRALAAPISLATVSPPAGRQVAVIGYPARDGRVADQQLMHDIFGDVYDRKRLAPGQIVEARRNLLLHDCSTLGGNSGSVLVDLESGAAAGLHFAGRFMEANYAVPSQVVARRLAAVLRKRLANRPSTLPTPSVVVPTMATPAHPPTAHHAASAVNIVSAVYVEGVVSDYVGRKGYDAAFLGPKVPLPTVKKKADVLTFTGADGRKGSELEYTHFSVVMNRQRRLCIFSAVNIDGKTPGRFKRPDWRLDPRIPALQQIRDECYGNEPLFSRGHMTRREDPIWGTEAEAKLGNSDSMHVTNTVPQMQPFNAGIWLSLESYALDHARSDKMRISVFTGPFFLGDDPIRAGVRIPRSFWKVIVFIHDQTRKLCATGYTMSQESFLRPEEFVFAQHATSQARVADIESRAGLSFGRLASLDPFDDGQEGIAMPLTDPSQIRWA